MNGRPTLNGQNGASCPSHLVSDTGSDLLTKPSSSPKSSVTDPLLPKAGRRSGRDVFDLFRGILLGGASSVFFLICTIIVKLLAEISPSQLAIYRFVGILACSIPIVLRHKLQHPHQSIFGPSNQFGTLLLRGMMGASSLLLRFYAYRYLPLADASVLIFSVPVFVTLTAYFFLNEPLGSVQVCSIVFTIFGICLTIQLPKVLLDFCSALSASTSTLRVIQTDLNQSSSSQDVSFFHSISSMHELSTLLSNHKFAIGVIAALGSIAFTNGIYITLRRLKGVHYSVVMFNFGWIALLESALSTALAGGFSWPGSINTGVLLLVLGLCSFAGQALLTLALQCDHASPVSLARCAVDILLSFIFQYVIFGQLPNAWSISGGLLIFSCILITSIEKIRQGK